MQFWQMHLPDRMTLGCARRTKVHNYVHSSLERAVDSIACVCRHDQNPLVCLEPLKQIIRFKVRVAIGRALHACPPRKQRIPFVEQENHVQLFGSRENLIQILLGFADVLVHDHR